MNNITCPKHVNNVLVSSKAWSDGSTTFKFEGTGKDVVGKPIATNCIHTTKTNRVSGIR